MKRSAAALSLLVTVSTSWAAERYTVTESVLLDASADAAWNAVKDFSALEGWHPAVTQTKVVVGEVPMRGAVRVLTVGDNEGEVHETLTAYSDETRSFSYVINFTDVLPVKDYVSTVSVVEVGENLSLVIWTGDFLSNPPDGEPDSMAQETMSSVYRAGLDNLQNVAGQ